MTTKDFTTKETAAALRRNLKVQWPGVKFSVRMASGTAYGWLRVSYEDGPQWQEVKAYTDAYTWASFNSMTDSYDIRPEDSVGGEWTTEDGERVWKKYSATSINVTRTFSQAALDRAAQFAGPGSAEWAIESDNWAHHPEVIQHYASQRWLQNQDYIG
jgi:hypothetical protein